MIRIRRNSVIVFLVLLLSMRWEINDYIGNSITQIAENGLRVFAALYCVFLYVKKRKGNMKISLVFLLLILMQGWLILSTAIQRGDLRSSIIGYLLPLLVVGFLVEDMLNDMDDFINGAMLFAEIIAYTNFLTIILFPDGLYSTYTQSDLWFTTHNWLLGHKQLFLQYFLLFCPVAYLYGCNGGRKWREYGVYLVSLLSVLITRSATGMVGIVLILVAIFAIKNKHIKLNVYFLVSVNVALFLLIVVFRAQNVFSFLIEDILKKDLTFTGRTKLWDAVMPLIRENLLCGLGVTKNGELQALTGIRFGMHPHNLILDYLRLGGIVELVLYLVAMALVYRQLHRYQNTNVAQVFSLTLFVFQVSMLVEVPSASGRMFIYLLYFMAYNVGRFIPQEEIEETSPKQRRIRIVLSD